MNRCFETRELLTNPLYFLEQLTGGTRALVRLCGLLRLEVSLQSLGVWGRGGLSVMGGHLGTVARCTHIVSGFIGTEPDVDGERVWKRGDQGMGSDK